MKRNKRNYWTLEKCKEIAKNFDTIILWKKNHNASYGAAHKRGYILQCVEHMIRIKKPHRFWNYDKCKEDALKYSTKIQWRNSSYGFIVARKNGWINDCCKHMTSIGSMTKRGIYAFEFPDKSVYVGLTFNFNKRLNQHIYYDLKNESIVQKYIINNGLNPRFVELTNYLDKDIASQKEGEFLEKYRKDSWKILNKAKTGGLGNCKIFWTKNICRIEALKYIHKCEWQNKSKPSYRAAQRNGWIDELSLHMSRPKSKKNDC